MSGMCSQRERAAHLQRHLACKLFAEAPFSRHTETRQAIPEQGGVPGVLHFYWACRQGGGRTVLQGALQVHQGGQQGRSPSPRLLP